MDCSASVDPRAHDAYWTPRGRPKLLLWVLCVLLPICQLSGNGTEFWCPRGNEFWCPGGNEFWCPGGNEFWCPGGNEIWCPGGNEIWCPGGNEIWCCGNEFSFLGVTWKTTWICNEFLVSFSFETCRSEMAPKIHDKIHVKFHGPRNSVFHDPFAGPRSTRGYTNPWPNPWPSDFRFSSPLCGLRTSRSV